MAVLNTSGISYTYDGKLSTDVLVKPMVQHPDILKLFRVIPDIRSKYQLHTTIPMNPIVQGGTGNCTRNEVNDPVSISNREIQTCELSFYVTQCSDVFEGTIFENALKTGTEVRDLTGTQIQNIINNELLIPAAARDVFKIMSFGDTGSGDSFINGCDGMWTKLIAGEATYEVKRATTALGATLSADEAIGSLEECFTEAEIILKQVPTNAKKFFVTGSIFENYQKTLETQNATEAGWMQIQDGVQKLYYRGVEVVPIYAWDEYLVASGAAAPHRILYTSVDNHVIGVEKANDVNKLDVWFSKDDNVMKYEGRFKIGYNYVHGDLQVIAY